MTALGAIPSSARSAAAKGRKRLSDLAYRTAGAEGDFTLTDIDGRLPEELAGTLVRVAPGQREVHGVRLGHFFDGDAFVMRFDLGAGRVRLRARFVPTPQREEERRARRMLYPDYGTAAPSSSGGQGAPGPFARRFKNSPNVNIIRWDGRLLGLSEGGHPSDIDPDDLSFRGHWSFHDTLPRDVPFTAHPRFDLRTGEGFGFGVRQGLGYALMVYRMERDGTLTELYALPQPGYFMIHDMLLSEQHLIFVIPPVRLDVLPLLSGASTVAEALRFAENEPTRIVILRRDGKGPPVTINQPATMVFHHGNAFEQDGKIVIDSVLNPDGSVLDLLATWGRDRPLPATPTVLTRLVLDPVRASVERRTALAEGLEYPSFDARRAGTRARYLYFSEWGARGDQLAFDAVTRFDLERKVGQRIPAGRGRTFGEAVFVAHPGQTAEDRGWLLTLGYDAVRDQSFLEIRDAGTMELQARVWTGNHFPLGFHGNFYAAA